VPEANLEIVRKAFGALIERGPEGLMDYVAPDGVAYTASEWVEGSEHRGHDGLRFLLSAWTENFDDWAVRDFELREAGDSVVALFEHGGRVRATETTISQRMGAVFSDFRDGRIGQARFFQTWRETLDAAGLSE
jgi:ketosteroid isomerase-like protein